MTKEEFQQFCKNYFLECGYRKKRNDYYLVGESGILSSIDLQKSQFSSGYYINFNFYLDNYIDVPLSKFPSCYDSDIDGRIGIMTVIDGECFETGLFEYKKYTPEMLKPYFDKAFDEIIFPPLKLGKKYILENLNILYDLSLNREEVLRKLKED